MLEGIRVQDSDFLPYAYISSLLSSAGLKQRLVYRSDTIDREHLYSLIRSAMMMIKHVSCKVFRS